MIEAIIIVGVIVVMLWKSFDNKFDIPENDIGAEISRCVSDKIKLQSALQDVIDRDIVLNTSIANMSDQEFYYYKQNNCSIWVHSKQQAYVRSSEINTYEKAIGKLVDKLKVLKRKQIDHTKFETA